MSYLREEALPALVLIRSIARKETSFLQSEEELMFDFLEELRALIPEYQNTDRDDEILAFVREHSASARALQEAAARLPEKPYASRLFPRFFAAMAIRSGVPTSEQRLRISRARSALRLAARPKR